MRALLLGAVALVLAGCGTSSPGTQHRTLDVLAAASLTGPFEALAARFEEDHPEVDVRLSFGSSAALAQQLLAGAPADLLATADERTMATAVDGGAAEPPTAFATNHLVLVTPANDPAGVDSVADLDRSGVAFLTCVASAPCGASAARLLDRNGVAASPVSLEADVKSVLTKVVTGEVDAGFVYSTDAEEVAHAVQTVQVPGAHRERNRCLAAVATRSDDRELAEAWVRRLVGGPGRDVLEAAGFGPATDTS